jgi:hypothetical protein
MSDLARMARRQAGEDGHREVYQLRQQAREGHLMLFAAIPPLLISYASSYTELLGVAFLMGMAKG